MLHRIAFIRWIAIYLLGNVICSLNKFDLGGSYPPKTYAYAKTQPHPTPPPPP